MWLFSGMTKSVRHYPRRSECEAVGSYAGGYRKLPRAGSAPNLAARLSTQDTELRERGSGATLEQSSILNASVGGVGGSVRGGAAFEHVANASDAGLGGMSVCAYLCVHACACASARARVRVQACVREQSCAWRLVRHVCIRGK